MFTRLRLFELCFLWSATTAPHLTYPVVKAGQFWMGCSFLSSLDVGSWPIDSNETGMHGLSCTADGLLVNVTAKHFAVPSSAFISDTLRPKSVRFFITPLSTIG